MTVDSIPFFYSLAIKHLRVDGLVLQSFITGKMTFCKILRCKIRTELYGSEKKMFTEIALVFWGCTLKRILFSDFAIFRISF